MEIKKLGKTSLHQITMDGPEERRFQIVVNEKFINEFHKYLENHMTEFMKENGKE